jgi:hypothetical protein
MAAMAWSRSVAVLLKLVALPRVYSSAPVRMNIIGPILVED